MARYSSSQPTVGQLTGPLLYLFLDTSDLPAKRRALEEALGFRPVEFEPHAPHEHHGVIKYDAGPVIVSLNLAARPAIPLWRHAMSTVVRADDPASVLARAGQADCTVDTGAGRFADVDGHVFTVLPQAGADDLPTPGPAAPVSGLRLAVQSVEESIRFYCGQLGLRVAEEAPGWAMLSTGNLHLWLTEQAGGESVAMDRRGYLIVYHCHDLKRTHSALQDRGVAFRSDIQDTEIGLTCRFADPDHHTLCLYEPSSESLSWGAGEKMKEIVRAAELPGNSRRKATERRSCYASPSLR